MPYVFALLIFFVASSAQAEIGGFLGEEEAPAHSASDKPLERVRGIKNWARRVLDRTEKNLSQWENDREKAFAGLQIAFDIADAMEVRDRASRTVASLRRISPEFPSDKKAATAQVETLVEEMERLNERSENTWELVSAPRTGVAGETSQLRKKLEEARKIEAAYAEREEAEAEIKNKSMSWEYLGLRREILKALKKDPKDGEFSLGDVVYQYQRKMLATGMKKEAIRENTFAAIDYVQAGVSLFQAIQKPETDPQE